VARKLEICKCYVCGNVVEVVHGGAGALWCCGRPMHVFSERPVDHEDEEYFPVCERTADGVKVTVGSMHHPMEHDHHIQWIEIIADGLVYRKFLMPRGSARGGFSGRRRQHPSPRVLHAARFVYRALTALTFKSAWRNIRCSFF